MLLQFQNLSSSGNAENMKEIDRPPIELIKGYGGVTDINKITPDECCHYDAIIKVTAAFNSSAYDYLD